MDEITHCSGRLLTNCHPYVIKFGRYRGRSISYFSPSREQQALGVEDTYAKLPRHHTLVQFLGKGFSKAKQRVYWIYEQVPYTLEQLIREEQLAHLHVSEILQIALDIAQAIDIAVQVGQVKRIDLRPVNIWITDNYRAKLHGIELHQHCGHGQMCSCSWFPEWQYHDVKNNNVDDMDDALALPAPGSVGAALAHQRDQRSRYSWTVGVILAELLHRRKFARRALTADILKNNEYEYIPKNASPDVKDLLKQCWRKNPADRITMGEIVSTLKDLIQKSRPKPVPAPAASCSSSASSAAVCSSLSSSSSSTTIAAVSTLPHVRRPLTARDALFARKQLKREMQEMIDQIRVEWQITNCADVAIAEQQTMGQGAFSTVYRGRWKSQLVAVKKFVSPTVSSDPVADRKRMQEIVDAFRHEVVTMMALCGVTSGGCAAAQQQRFGGESYVVRFLGACKSPPFIVYELMPYNLRTVLSVQQRRFSQMPDQTRLLSAVANSLAYLHAQRTPHLDLKPDNIMMCPHKNPGGAASSPRINAREFDFDVKLSDISGTTSGSWAYRSPECLPSSQFFSNDVDPFKVDIWSFGIVVAEIASSASRATSQPIFHDMNEYEIAAEWDSSIGGETDSSGLPQRLLQAVEQIQSDDLRQLALQCLAVNPKQRPTARAVMRTLRESVSNLSNTASPTMAHAADL